MKRIFYILFAMLTLNQALTAALIHTSGDGNWALTSTWTGGALPGITDNVQVDNNDSLWVVVGDSYTVSEIWMGNNSILNIEGNLTIDSLHINNNATLYVSGTLTINGGVSISNNAGLTVNQTGTMDVNGDIAASNNTTLTVNGDVNVTGDVAFSGNGSLNVGSTGTLDITGNLDTGNATVDGTGPVTVSGTVSGTNSGDSQINTLPVELIKFELVFNEPYVEINWVTASELNNNYFTIQRSDDGKTYFDIDNITGAGNSNSLRSYVYKDYNELKHVSYYRLKQTDYDGFSEIFKAKAITLNSPSQTSELEIYPNPANSNSYININFIGFNTKNAITVDIINLLGEHLKQITYNSDISGQLSKSLSLEGLVKGIYFVNLKEGSTKYTKKLIVQ